jgi:hypothetical protein
MMRKLLFIIITLLITSMVYAQEDGLNLPTELYVLTNSGQVQQYGVGIAGIKTVTPEDQFVVDFGIAPDGSWLAYRTQDGLKLLNIYSGSAEDVEGTTAGLPAVRGQGDTIAWSPSGDALVYTTGSGGRVYFTGKKTFLDLPQGQFTQIIWSPTGSYLAAEADENIWWLYRREGDNLILHGAIPSALGLAWAGDTQVVFAPGDGGLIRMDLAAANAQSTLLDNTWDYALPTRAADGTILVFGRQKEAEDVPVGSAVLLGLAADSPSIENLSQAAVDLTGLGWAPGGNLLIALRGGVMALVIPSSGQGLTLPVSEAVAYSWGPPPIEVVTGLELPADGFFLAESVEGFKQVWRLPQNGESSTPVTNAPADVTAFAVSPNQRNVAYASGGQLWLQALTGGDAQSLATIATETRHITFSPDETRIAYDTLSTEEQPAGGIWQVSASGGEPEQLLINGPAGQAVNAPPFYRDPQYATNINALLVAVGGSETTSYAVLDLSTLESLDIGAFDQGHWLRDGNILGYGNGVGIGDPPATQDIAIVTPADGTRRMLISLGNPAHVVSMRDINGKTRLVLGNYGSGPQPLSVVDLDASTGGMSAPINAGFMANPLLSPDGNFVAGQRHPDGPLMFRDLTTGKTTTIIDPPTTSGFVWGA